MTPVDAAIIKRKLAVIVENIRTLEPIKGMSREDYIGDVYKRKATERLLGKGTVAPNGSWSISPQLSSPLHWFFVSKSVNISLRSLSQ